jgi:hypothetical protein
VAATAHFPTYVLDANFVINLIHAARLNLLAALGSYRFVVPDEVVEEITEPLQRQQLQAALNEDLSTENPLRTRPNWIFTPNFVD